MQSIRQIHSTNARSAKSSTKKFSAADRRAFELHLRQADEDMYKEFRDTLIGLLEKRIDPTVVWDNLFDTGVEIGNIAANEADRLTHEQYHELATLLARWNAGITGDDADVNADAVLHLFNSVYRGTADYQQAADEFRESRSERITLICVSRRRQNSGELRWGRAPLSHFLRFRTPERCCMEVLTHCSAVHFRLSLDYISHRPPREL